MENELNATDNTTPSSEQDLDTAFNRNDIERETDMSIKRPSAQLKILADTARMSVCLL